MIESVTWTQAGASVVLVAVAIGLSLWLQLGLSGRILVAAARAAVQLVAVGFVLGFIVSSDRSMALAWLWVLLMVVVTAVVAHRRAPELPSAAKIAVVAIVTTVALCLLVVFGLGVIPYEPVNLIVIAGITIGNTMPAMVLGANRLMSEVRDNRGQIEALLSLGMNRAQVVRSSGGMIARTALIPQIERTNVVGLIALPGAMTGLLLGGVDPIDAVLVQVVVMYLVLGSVATSVILTVVLGFRDLLPNGLVLANVSFR